MKVFGEQMVNSCHFCKTSHKHRYNMGLKMHIRNCKCETCEQKINPSVNLYIKSTYFPGSLSCQILLMLVFLAVFVAPLQAAPKSPYDLEGLRKVLGDAAVSYSDAKDLWLFELESGKTIKLGKGASPEFSPDGQRLAWIQGDKALGRLRSDETIHTIVADVEEQGGVHWISNFEIVVRLKKGGWHRVTLAGEKEVIEELNKIAHAGRETDVKLCDDGVWSYVAGRIWRTSDGGKGQLPGTCSASLSPDGKSVGGLQPGHREFKYVAIREGGKAGKLKWKYEGPKNDKGFDNHRWASQDARLFLVADELYNQPAIMMVGSDKAWRVGEKVNNRRELYGDITATAIDKDTPWHKQKNNQAEASERSNTQDDEKKAVNETDQQKEIERVEVKVKLVKKCQTPEPDNYPQALAVYEYKVLEVTSGKLPEKQETLFIARWVVRDKQVISKVAELKVGEQIKLTIQPFDADKSLSDHQIALPEGDAVIDAKWWYVVE